MEEISDKEFATFVGPRASYYVRAWREIREDRSSFGGFNGAAFFLTFGWLLYRRLYRVLAIFLGIVLLASLASDAAFRHWGIESPPRSYDLLTFFIYAGCTGVLGNRWYYNHARRRIQALKAGGNSSESALARHGGTRWVAPIVFALFVLLVRILSEPVSQ